MSEWRLLIDQREKKPYEFSGIDNVEFRRLDVGDYTIEGFEDEFAVERKTLDDFARSVGADRERFEDEIKRGVANGMDELEVVIEAPRWHVSDYTDRKYSPRYYSNIYPKSIIGTIDSWRDKYEPLDFTWAGNREGGQAETLRLLDKWFVKRRFGSE